MSRADQRLLGLGWFAPQHENQRLDAFTEPPDDRVGERRVEPHRLVSLGRRWYLVGFDLDRDDWRTYRVDRVSELAGTGHRNTPRDTPDAAALVSEGVAVRVFDIQARVRVSAPAHEASMWIGPTVGVVEHVDDSSCLVTIGGDPDWIARYLVGLPVAFDVLEPPSVLDELRLIATQILSQLESPLPVPGTRSDPG